MTRFCACGCGRSLEGYRANRQFATTDCRRRRQSASDARPPRRKPQRERILNMFKAAGSRGVHSHEIYEARICNPSQRIAELEAAGYVITHTRERLHGRAFGTRYRLVSEPGQIEAAA